MMIMIMIKRINKVYNDDYDYYNDGNDNNDRK